MRLVHSDVCDAGGALSPHQALFGPVSARCTYASAVTLRCDGAFLHKTLSWGGPCARARLKSRLTPAGGKSSIRGKHFVLRHPAAALRRTAAFHLQAAYGGGAERHMHKMAAFYPSRLVRCALFCMVEGSCGLCTAACALFCGPLGSSERLHVVPNNHAQLLHFGGLFHLWGRALHGVHLFFHARAHFYITFPPLFVVRCWPSHFHAETFDTAGARRCAAIRAYFTLA